MQTTPDVLQAVASGLALQQKLYTDDDGVVDILSANGYMFASVLALRVLTERGYENTYLYSPLSQLALDLLTDGFITARQAITNTESGIVLCAVNKRLGATSPGIWSEISIADIPDAWLPRFSARCVNA